MVFAIPGYRLGFTGLAAFENPSIVPYNLAIYGIHTYLKFFVEKSYSSSNDESTHNKDIVN